MDNLLEYLCKRYRSSSLLLTELKFVTHTHKGQHYHCFYAASESALAELKQLFAKAESGRMPQVIKAKELQHFAGLYTIRISDEDKDDLMAALIKSSRSHSDAATAAATPRVSASTMRNGPPADETRPAFNATP